MKTLIALLLLFCCSANAEVIVSLAAKHGKKETRTNTVTNTNPVMDKKKKKVTGYTTSSNTDSNDTYGTDLGVLVQASTDSVPLVLGVGYFQDNTSMLTLGFKFK